MIINRWRELEILASTNIQGMQASNTPNTL
jgi:hypothetical protein